MKVGSIVRITRRYKSGTPREQQDVTRIGKIIGIYPNYIMIEFKHGIRECFFEYEIEIIEE